MRIIISPDARQEIAAHIAYIKERNLGVAKRQRQRISVAIQALRDAPYLGRPGRLEGTRELVISGTPLIAVYEVSSSQISIVHVYHGRQDWQN
ncbi:MAG: type II toxin-antitoxin system RelE/ParE family toxin [Chloroflexaceae bacterium]|jgi:plasmid stabilization system protein ParE|nr:type II toxin-antitoxin system RelE/ParE family toxin [Chloroflexaceae bacterium]